MRLAGSAIGMLSALLMAIGCSGESDSDERLARCRGWELMSDSDKWEAARASVDSILEAMAETMREADHSKWPAPVQTWKSCVIELQPEIVRVRDEMCARTSPPTVGEMIAANDRVLAPCAAQLRKAADNPDPAA